MLNDDDDDELYDLHLQKKFVDQILRQQKLRPAIMVTIHFLSLKCYFWTNELT